MKKIIFAAALSAGLLAFGDIGEFAKKVAFTVEYEGAGSLSGIPVLVRLAANSPVGFSYSDCAADGSDIRFTDANDEAIPFEIDTWNTEGESLVWVKPTSLAKGATFTMHFCGTPAEANDPTAVWTEYAGVWHFGALGEDETQYSQGLYPNSTAAENIDAHLSVKSIAGEEGRFGKAFRTNDSTDWNAGNFNEGGAWVIDTGDDSPLDVGDVFTVSGWIKHQKWHFNYDRVIYKRSDSDNSKSDPAGAFVIEMQSNSFENKLAGKGTGDNRLRVTYVDGDPNPAYEWMQFTFVFDGQTHSLYENGGEYSTSAKYLSKVVNNDAPLAFGNTIKVANGETGANAWNGWIDEIRIARGAKSAEWIAAEYAAMTSDRFLSVGTVVSDVPVPGEVSVVSEATKSTISGTIVSLGTGATAADVYLAIGPSAEELGEVRKIASGVMEAFSHGISGLASQTTYCYELTVVNNATPARSVSLRGSFTTEPRFEFRRRVAFTIGYEGAGADTLSGVPVLVKLAANSPAGFRYADCATGGCDIRFTDADGKQIPFEIDTWDPKGESIIWVKPSTIAKGTTFTMYYKGRADALPDPREVWTGYSGVWHFGALGADATPYSQGLYPNSTASENIDAHLSAKSIAGEDGRFGKAFRPNDSTGLKAGNWNEGGAWVVDAGENSPIDSDNGKLTISGWIKHQNWNNAGEKIFYKRMTTNGKPDADTPTGAFVVEAQQAPNFGITKKKRI